MDKNYIESSRYIYLMSNIHDELGIIMFDEI